MSSDPTASSRKKDHIQLAFESQVGLNKLDQRFFYEPMLSAHPKGIQGYPSAFLGKKLSGPIWVSSMTGGTALAGKINVNLAKACKEFGLGMGLGSCRGLLENDEYLHDFNVREHIGDQPLYANLGIAQVEILLEEGKLDQISALVNKLQADGLIIHVNPMQEWLQPEGDHIKNPPIETITEIVKAMDLSIIVKEVGQGIGYHSLKALLQLPIDAIEFGASGGTNFSLLELLRADEDVKDSFESMVYVGHSALDMVTMLNQLIDELGHKAQCRSFIISGGIQNFLDGYYLMEKLQHKAIYGQASAMLKYAAKDYNALQKFISRQMEGLSFASSYLRVKE